MRSDWRIDVLGNVCSFYNGAAHEKNIHEDGRYKVVNSKFVSTNGNEYKCSNSALSPLFHNDIVMVMSDVPNGKALGKCFIIDKDDTYTLNQRICAIRSNEFDTKFLFYQLNRNAHFLSYNNGENQTNLRKDDILKCELLIPPLPEQKHIVAILDEAFAAIDKAKANAEKNLQNAKALFETYLNEVFVNKGDDWEEKAVSDLGIVQTGTTPKTSEKNNYGNYIPFIKPADIDISGDGGIRYDNDGLSKVGLVNARKILPDSILMVCIGATIGKVGLATVEVSCNQQINTLTPRKGLFPKFFYYAMRSKDFYEQVIRNSSQATLPIINKSKWERLLIYYPNSIAEQRLIVRKLDLLIAETKRLEEIYEQKIEELEALKKAILSKAFSGELSHKPIPELV